jgi:HAMP domain-containing protein
VSVQQAGQIVALVSAVGAVVALGWLFGLQARLQERVQAMSRRPAMASIARMRAPLERIGVALTSLQSLQGRLEAIDHDFSIIVNSSTKLSADVAAVAAATQELLEAAAPLM